MPEEDDNMSENEFDGCLDDDDLITGSDESLSPYPSEDAQ